MKSKIEYGIIVGRFQTPLLTQGHTNLINSVLTNHKVVAIFLGDSKSIRTDRNPLDFCTRKKMIQDAYPNISVVQILDCPNDNDWSANLDKAIIDFVPLHVKPVLYGSRDSFIKSYNGKFKTVELKPEVEISASEIRSDIVRSPINTEEARRGIIHAVYNRPGLTFATVDVLPCFENKVLLGRKKIDGGKWRCIGGFVDSVKDKSNLAAAKRELYEETSLSFSDNWENLGSFKIDDYRYKGTSDSIMTTLYICDCPSDKAKNGDDIDEIGWFDINTNLYSLIVPEHIMLITTFLFHKKSNFSDIEKKAEQEKLQELINRQGGWTDGKVICEGSEAIVKTETKVAERKGISYLAGPYSSEFSEVCQARYDKLCQTAVVLMKSGIIVYSPIIYGHNLVKMGLPGDFNYWGDFCLSILKNCQSLIVAKIDGWEESSGVKAEIDFAKSNGIPVLFTEV